MEKIFDWKQYSELRTQMDFMKNYHSNEIYLSLLGGKIIFPLMTMGSGSGSKKYRIAKYVCKNNSKIRFSLKLNQCIA